MNLVFWQQVTIGVGIVTAIIALIAWLVRQLVTSAQRSATAQVAIADKNATGRIAAAELKADQMIAAASKAADAVVVAQKETADNRVHDSDLRADEWKETATLYQNALQQQRDIAIKALEVNQMTDRYFGSLRLVPTNTGDNTLEVSGG
jgi:hypothetical protein